MIATLPQLHDNVEESDLLHLTDPINNIYVLQQDGSVPEREREREGGGKGQEKRRMEVELLPSLPPSPPPLSLHLQFSLHFTKSNINLGLLLWREFLLHV